MTKLQKDRFLIVNDKRSSSRLTTAEKRVCKITKVTIMIALTS